MNNDRQFQRGPGRPRWSGERVSKCDVRLNEEENRMLDELADRHEVSRSTIVRKALKDFYKFNNKED